MEIRNNKLTGADLQEIVILYPNLYKLKIGQNLIKSTEQLKCLSKINSLKKLEVLDNEITKNPNYRNELFKILASLESIDNKDKKGGSVETTLNDEDDEDNKYKKSIKVNHCNAHCCEKRLIRYLGT